MALSLFMTVSVTLLDRVSVNCEFLEAHNYERLENKFVASLKKTLLSYLLYKNKKSIRAIQPLLHLLFSEILSVQ